MPPEKSALALTRHPLGLIGAGLTTASAMLILALLGVELLGFHPGPYIGILVFGILPAVFLLGLVLMPLGLWRERRRQRLAALAGAPPPAFPVIDLNLERTRARFLLFLGATVLNLVILALATFKAVEVMESTPFCGTTCHQVMEPEFTAHQRSPHARVGCVSCHIGPGADWFVKSKLSGSWQVVSVALNLYPRPIPTPVANLRPARETCEQCHWPASFVGDRLQVRTHFSPDQANTETKSVLLLRVGGIQGRTSQGIHWHVDPKVQIRYRADKLRQKIGDVEMRVEGKPAKVFRSAAAGEGLEDWRVMDCVDCHNRPTHIYQLPGPGIDAAIREGKIDRSLPYIKREGLAALQAVYTSKEAARLGIQRRLLEFYSRPLPAFPAPSAAAVESAAAALFEVWRVNVFPHMKVTWGTYPDHLGHAGDGGCFRCHDEEHATAGGEKISQDCNLCHNLLAMEEEDPEILKSLQP